MYFNPETIPLSPTWPHLYKSGNAVFIRKHGVEENTRAVAEALDLPLNCRKQDWIFLVEGHKVYSCPENVFLDSKLKEFGLEAVDPIVKPYSEEIAKDLNISPLETALSVLVNDSSGVLGIDLSLVQDDELEKWFLSVTDLISVLFNVQQLDLIKAHESLFLSDSKGTSLEEKLKQLKQIHKIILDESNRRSQLMTHSVLTGNSKPNIFILSGKAHKSVFLGDYS